MTTFHKFLAMDVRVHPGDVAYQDDDITHSEEAMTTTAHTVPFHQRHDEELLSLSEVSEILKTPENTLRWWRQIGKGPQFFKIGRRLVTTVGDVRQFMREQRLAAQPVIPAPRRP